MHLPETLAAERCCWLGGGIYWVRPLSLAGYALVIAWLDDVLPGKAERKEPPEWASEAAQAEMASAAGNQLLLWLALRDQGVDWMHAGLILDRTEERERLRLRDVLFSRRRTYEPEPESGTDLGRLWCGKGWASLATELGGLDRLGALSLDQVEFLLSGGECDVDPTYSTENLAKMQADWKDNQLPVVLKLLAEQQAAEVLPSAPDHFTGAKINGEAVDGPA